MNTHSNTHTAIRPTDGHIDTHAHLWSTEYLDQLKSLMQQAGASDATADARVDHAMVDSGDLSARIKMMDQAGVQYQVLSATPQSPSWGSADQAALMARQINDLYADVIKQHPDRFLAYGAVPLPYVDEAIIEARRCIDELGFMGIAINTLIKNELSIADPKLLPFYQAMDEMGAVIYIHPTGCGAASPMVNDFDLHWVVGAPIEDTVAVLQLLKANIPQKFPNIQFHVAHLGGFLPFVMQRIEDNYNDWQAFDHSPWQSLSQFWFDTANFHPQALQCSCQTFGSERLMMGSDFPYFQFDKYTRACEYITHSNLAPSVQQAILSDNAKRLFAKHFN